MVAPNDGNGVAGAAGADDIRLDSSVKDFISSSFSVLRAKQKSDTLFWNVTNNCVKSL